MSSTNDRNPISYVDAEGAAVYTTASLSKIRHMTSEGTVPHITLGRRVVYDVRDLDVWMRAGTEGRGGSTPGEPDRE